MHFRVKNGYLKTDVIGLNLKLLGVWQLVLGARNIKIKKDGNKALIYFSTESSGTLFSTHSTRFCLELS